MKFLAAIISIYFLGLTLVPCEDAASIQGDNAEFHEIDNFNHSSSHKDDCSPFCQCHCCHVHITNFESSEAGLITFEISTTISEKNYDLGDTIPRSFFQPPRV